MQHREHTLATKKTTKTSARAQAANARRIGKNKLARTLAAKLTAAGLLPKGASKNVSIPQGGRKNMTAEQRTLRRKTMSYGIGTVEQFFTPEGTKKKSAPVVKAVSKAQAKKLKQAGHRVVTTPNGSAVILSKNETVSKQGSVKTKLSSKNYKQFKITPEFFKEDDDGEIQSLNWLRRAFAKLIPGDEYGFIFSENGSSVSTITTFKDADSMFIELEMTYELKFQEKYEHIGYLVLVPRPQLKAMENETIAKKKERKKKYKKKYKPRAEMTPRQRADKQQYDQRRYAIKRMKKK
jgi:hypothetical protein